MEEEQVSNNTFFQYLQKSNVLQQAVKKSYIIAIPPSAAIPPAQQGKPAFSRDFSLSHVLLKSTQRPNVYYTLSGRTLLYQDDELITVSTRSTSWPDQRVVKILSEETYYTEDFESFTILHLSLPLIGPINQHYINLLAAQTFSPHPPVDRDFNDHVNVLLDALGEESLSTLTSQTQAFLSTIKNTYHWVAGFERNLCKKIHHFCYALLCQILTSIVNSQQLVDGTASKQLPKGSKDGMGHRGINIHDIMKQSDPEYPLSLKNWSEIILAIDYIVMTKLSVYISSHLITSYYTQNNLFYNIALWAQSLLPCPSPLLQYKTTPPPCNNKTTILQSTIIPTNYHPVAIPMPSSMEVGVSAEIVPPPRFYISRQQYHHLHNPPHRQPQHNQHHHNNNQQPQLVQLPTSPLASASVIQQLTHSNTPSPHHAHFVFDTPTHSTPQHLPTSPLSPALSDGVDPRFLIHENSAFFDYIGLRKELACVDYTPAVLTLHRALSLQEFITYDFQTILPLQDTTQRRGSAQNMATFITNRYCSATMLLGELLNVVATAQKCVINHYNAIDEYYEQQHYIQQLQQQQQQQNYHGKNLPPGALHNNNNNNNNTNGLSQPTLFRVQSQANEDTPQQTFSPPGTPSKEELSINTEDLIALFQYFLILAPPYTVHSNLLFIELFNPIAKVSEAGDAVDEYQRGEDDDGDEENEGEDEFGGGFVKTGSMGFDNNLLGLPQDPAALALPTSKMENALISLRTAVNALYDLFKQHQPNHFATLSAIKYDTQQQHHQQQQQQQQQHRRNLLTGSRFEEDKADNATPQQQQHHQQQQTPVGLVNSKTSIAGIVDMDLFNSLTKDIQTPEQNNNNNSRNNNKNNNNNDDDFLLDALNNADDDDDDY